jgi:hypothetical protein
VSPSWLLEQDSCGYEPLLPVWLYHTIWPEYDAGTKLGEGLEERMSSAQPV